MTSPSFNFLVSPKRTMVRLKKYCECPFFGFQKPAKKNERMSLSKSSKSTNSTLLLLLLFDGCRRCFALLSPPAVSCSNLWLQTAPKWTFDFRKSGFIVLIWTVFLQLGLAPGPVCLYFTLYKSTLPGVHAQHRFGMQFTLKPDCCLSLHALERHFFLPCFICNANGRRQLPSCVSVINPKPGVGGGKEEEKINKTAG